MAVVAARHSSQKITPQPYGGILFEVEVSEPKERKRIILALRKAADHNGKRREKV